MKLTWDNVGERLYETGVDHGVLYVRNEGGAYSVGVPWSGITSVTESPSGAESNPQYADNIKYLNLISAEEFGATIEAFTYPDEFMECDGSAMVQPGVMIGQQNRKTFGLTYRTKLGNDTVGQDYGYKLHIIYGATAAPSERAYATVNESPEAMTLSWEMTTIPIPVEGFKPTATLTFDSTTADPAALKTLEDLLYGTETSDATLPLPDAILAIFSGTSIEVTPVAPAYNSATHTVTIPNRTGVIYMVEDEAVTGSVVITEDTIVTATPAPGYKFPESAETDWTFEF